MSKVISGLYYSKEHEWIKVEGNVAHIGITDHAQEAMGDIVYVDPGQEGASLSAGDAVGVIESVKAASDVFSPLSGTIVKVNEALGDTPEILNEDAFGNFIFALELSDEGELGGLMDSDAYTAFCAE